MKYSIVYSSRTGNTGQLAECIKKHMPPQMCHYYGEPCEAAKDADMLYVGFWTDKGTCDAAAGQFLKTLRHKKIFLFGTAGFGGSADYFAQILSRVTESLDPSNEITGTFMCQGKMPLSVRKRYESMSDAEPEKMQAMIDNFDRALSHPNQEDFLRLEEQLDL